MGYHSNPEPILTPCPIPKFSPQRLLRISATRSMCSSVHLAKLALLRHVFLLVFSNALDRRMNSILCGEQVLLRDRVFDTLQHALNCTDMIRLFLVVSPAGCAIVVALESPLALLV